MLEDRFSRVRLLLGEDALQRLHKSRVVIAGLGAVGGYAMEALVRAGVGGLRLIDFDEVRLSNINRQLCALESTIGKRKVEVAAQRALDINPACDVEAHCAFIDTQTAPELLQGADLLIDAIDSLNPKVELLSAALASKTPLISAMGAALRKDPSKIRVGSLTQVRGCSLARTVRHRLRKRGHPTDLLCVYSEEQPQPAFLVPDAALPEAYERGRVRNKLGSLPTITGIAGLTAAQAGLEILLSVSTAEDPVS